MKLTRRLCFEGGNAASDAPESSASSGWYQPTSPRPSTPALWWASSTEYALPASEASCCMPPTQLPMKRLIPAAMLAAKSDGHARQTMRGKNGCQSRKSAFAVVVAVVQAAIGPVVNVPRDSARDEPERCDQAVAVGRVRLEPREQRLSRRAELRLRPDAEVVGQPVGDDHLRRGARLPGDRGRRGASLDRGGGDRERGAPRPPEAAGEAARTTVAAAAARTRIILARYTCRT